MRAAVSGSASRSSAAVSAAISSSPPAGTFSATSSGSSANQPTSLTTTGFPSESVRIALPDVSPIVGARSSTHASQAAISDQSRCLLDVRLADHALRVEARPLEPAGEVEARRLRADEQQPRAGMRPPQLGERAQQLRDPLALVDVPEAADQRRALDRRRLDVGRRPGRMRDPPERPVVAVVARPLLDVVRVDDQTGGAVEHLAGERELLRPNLPERRHAALEHAVAEQPSGHARLALHRGEIRVSVLASDRQTGDEMVDHPVVEDDDARLPAQRVDDPAVRVRVVADVVERHVDAADRPRPAGPHHLDLDEPLQRRQQQRRVVGDPRRVRRQR